MAQEVSVIVSADDRARLEAIVGKPQPAPQARAAGADRAAVDGPIAGGGGGQAGEREPTGGVALAAPVRRARRERPAARQDPAAGNAPLPADTVARVVAMTCAEPPGEASHWTGRAMAQEAGISLSSVLCRQHPAVALRLGRLDPDRPVLVDAHQVSDAPRGC